MSIVVLVTEVKSSGVFNGAGFKTPLNDPNALLTSDGGYNDSVISGLSNAEIDITNIQNQINSSQVHIGANAGSLSQGDNTVAIGTNSGEDTQRSGSVAIGVNSGQFLQNIDAVAIGNLAGNQTQGFSAVSIGSGAGQSNQGDFSIAIGKYAGHIDQKNNSIYLNASGNIPANIAYQNIQGFFVNPIRNNNTLGSNIVCYSPTTNELSYNTSGISSPAFTIASATGRIQYSVASTTLPSATTITPTRNIHFVSGIIQISTITNIFGSPSSAQITLIPTGLWTTSVSGNIALASVAVVNRPLILTWDSGTTKWYPSY